ncbi:MAG: hypothetical protein RL499_1383 [Actinomycetota bacterium]|jgi:hypothetical protein
MLRSTLTYCGPARGNGHLSKPVRAFLVATGGIVSTRELKALGVDQTLLELYRDYRSLQAVRQGWHCHPDVAPLNRLAWRFGGPLACVSALAFHASGATDVRASHSAGSNASGGASNNEGNEGNGGIGGNEGNGGSGGNGGNGGNGGSGGNGGIGSNDGGSAPSALSDASRERLHVCVPANTRVIPSPELLAARWGIPIALEPVVHWSTRDSVSGNRLAVSRTVALRQADHCRELL